MRRALVLIITLTALSFGAGTWLDGLQRATAQDYLQMTQQVYAAAQQGDGQRAMAQLDELRRRWQGDAQWLNCLISHHHTRAVNTALTKLHTALANDLHPETLEALDETIDALQDIETGEIATWPNIL